LSCCFNAGVILEDEAPLCLVDVETICVVFGITSCSCWEVIETGLLIIFV